MSAPTRGLDIVRLHGRSAFALLVVTLVGVAAFTWPFFAGTAATADSSGLPHSTDAPWLFVALLPLLLGVLFAEIADGSLDAKGIAMLGVLAACGAALRPIGGGATGFTGVFFLMIPAGRVLGRGFGFVLGALTLFASALLTAGVGPWLPFQMVAAGWVGFGAGCLPPARGRREVALLAFYAAFAGLSYGLVMNLWFWPFAHDYPRAISYLPGASMATNLVHWLHHDVVTSLGFDLPRAFGNFVFVLVAGRPVLAALRRAARRAAFEQPVVFTASEVSA
ncbi:MAG TPA: ECF transporter S component [Mycobacteriales bacterium]|nr:ECF transporter S component [Mycobacteriales bacterium]